MRRGSTVAAVAAADRMARAAALVAALALAAAVPAASQVFNVLEHLASKGPYFPKQNFSQHTPPPPQCVPAHLNLVARHGSRSSGDDDILEFIRIEGLINQYASSIRAPYASWMVGWTNPWPFEDEGKLLYTGTRRPSATVIAAAFHSCMAS